MRIAFLVAALLAACVESQSTVCMDDRVCPGDKVCDEAHGLCVDQDQLDACTGQAELAACDAAAMGRCYDGVCLVGGCGNGIVEPADPRVPNDTDERCDDGNRNDGDGCSADCKSEETCGNRVVDLITNETCDDGNAFSHDGCSSNCRLEAARWVSLPSFVKRGQTAMAFDSNRGRVVLFGGIYQTPTSVLYASTYEHDGQRWHPAGPELEPSPRRAASAAYDFNRHVVVLFGGHDGSVLGDTWEWNGAAWKLINTPMPPPPRSQSAMVFDAANDRVLMMGGYDNNFMPLDDTWTWDGQVWTQLVEHGPFARAQHTMIYDPVRNVTVLFGGNGPGPLTDTWEFDGATWTQKATSGPSGAVTGAFDPVQKVPLLLEMNVGAWRWNGSAWTQGTEPWNGSGWTEGGNVVTDTVRSRMLAFDTDGKTIVYDGTAWTLEASGATVEPPPMFAFGLARDPSRRRVVVYGGTSPPPSANAPLTPLSTTWAWDGTWKNLGDVAGSAGARFWPGFVFDEAHGKYVVFGGANGNTSEVNTTFSSPDGVTWTAEVTPSGLSARAAPAMVYDQARANIVLFGGNHYVGSVIARDDYADTWIWNGTWQQVTPAHAPTKRNRAAAAYDPVRQRVVVFGGVQQDLGKRLNDTWEWDGTDWAHMTPAVSPPPRMGGALAWDATRQRLVLMGGFEPSSGARDDAWEWDGTTWRQLLTTQPPGIRTDLGMFTAFDGGGVVAMLGGRQFSNSWSTSVDASVVQLHRDSEIPDETCVDGTDVDLDGLAGCTDADCWTVCTPSCPPGTSCMSAPQCGDSACNASVEDCASCPGDCGPC